MAGLKTTERAAIYTTSGQKQVEFTGDIDKLHNALLQLRSRSITDPGGIPQCPDISYYMSDRLVNSSDPSALSLAALEVQACVDPNMTTAQAASYAQGVAQRVFNTAGHETQVSLIVLKDVVRRMALMPGQRIVVLVSPGFLTPQQQPEKSDVIDRAIHGNVLINTLDARGLWVDPTLDASSASRTFNTGFDMLKRQFDRDSASAQADVLAEMAVGTGGSFFQNNNDLDAGLRRLTIAPDYYY